MCGCFCSYWSVDTTHVVVSVAYIVYVCLCYGVYICVLVCIKECIGMYAVLF